MGQLPTTFDSRSSGLTDRIRAIGDSCMCWCEWGRLLFGYGHVDEPRPVQLSGHGDRVGGSAAVLGDNEVSLAGPGGFLVVVVVPVQQDDHVGVGFDGAGFPQVSELWAFVGAGLGAAVELGDGDD